MRAFEPDRNKEFTPEEVEAMDRALRRDAEWYREVDEEDMEAIQEAAALVETQEH